MRKNQLVKLLIAAVVIGAIGLGIKIKKGRSWEAQDELIAKLVLPDFPVNDVERLEVTNKDGKVQLARRDGMWRVEQRHGYPADFGDISEFLRDLVDLKATQTIAVGPSQYGRLELLPPPAPPAEGTDASEDDSGDDDGDKEEETTGTEVKFFGAGDKLLATLMLGKEHEKKSDASPMGGMGGMMGGMGGGGWPDGRFLLVPGSDDVVLVSKTFSSVTTKPKDWLEKEFFKIGDMQTGKLTQRDEALWEVKREKKGDDMKLLGLEEGQDPDDSKIRSISSAFSWASFEDVADPELSPEETGMDNPKVFTATDFDGFTYTVKVGKENKDSKYYIAVDIDYAGPDAREAEEGESDEDKAKKDEEFKKKQEENKKKAEDTKKRVDGWVYTVSKYTVENVLKERTDLIKKKEEKKDEDKKDDDAKDGDAAAETKTEAGATATDAKAAADKAVEAVKEAAEGAAGAAAAKLDQMKKGTDAEAAKPAVKIE